MRIKTLPGKIFRLLKEAGVAFIDDKVMKLSAALAYYTVFSMGPMLLVIILLCSVFFGKQAIEGTMYEEISAFVGEKAAVQIQEIIRNASISGNSTVAAIVGIGTLLFGATGVFVEIQDSINYIWGLKAKPEKGLLHMLVNRLLSFSLVIGLGFVLMVSLILDRILSLFNERLNSLLPEAAVATTYVINNGVNFLVTASLFAVIFKVLPDARIRWRDVAVGACFTAILFLLGKLAISFYMAQADIGSSYGVAGSLVVILLWVYYSSAILYFGAEFTEKYAEGYGDHIHPDSYAVWVEKIEVQHRTSLEEVKKKKNKSPSGSAGASSGV